MALAPDLERDGEMEIEFSAYLFIAQLGIYLVEWKMLCKGLCSVLLIWNVSLVVFQW